MQGYERGKWILWVRVPQPFCHSPPRKIEGDTLRFCKSKHANISNVNIIVEIMH